MKLLKCIFWFALLVVFSACGKFSGLGSDTSNLFGKPKASRDFYYTSEYKMLEMNRIRRRRTCMIHEFSLETTYPQLGNKTFTVNGQFFLPRNVSTDVPVVLIFPPVGGMNTLDEEMAKTFCDSKIAVFVPTTDMTGLEQEAIPPVEDHNQALYRVVSFTKALAAYAADEAGLNGEKVGLMGASLGGILSSFAMSVVPEVSVGYFIVAGGDLPSVLAHS